MPRNRNARFSVGQPFGRWTIAGPIISHGRKTLVLCECQCGTKKTIRTDALSSGDSMSCGCWAREFHKDRLTTNDLSRTTEYRTWWHIIDRCYNPDNPSYDDYGGRGIGVCDRWRYSVEDFVLDVGKRPSPDLELDRINNNGNYEPSNVRWTTRTVQARNTRRNRHAEFNGIIMCLSEWCEILGVSRETIRTPLNRGCKFQDIIRDILRRKRETIGDHVY